jgi:hypothetical protein
VYKVTIPMLMFCVLTLLPGSASAAKPASGIKQLFGIAAASDVIVIPQEWGGIWTSVDSTYDCTGAFQFVDGSADTLCPGAVVVDPGLFPITYDCTGNADATTVNVECSGSAELMPDCMATYTYSMHGTRSGDSYFMVSSISTSYSGTAKGCDLVPSSCTQFNSHGTRTGPAPIEYCQTPALPSSWGELKVRYR